MPEGNSTCLIISHSHWFLHTSTFLQCGAPKRYKLAYKPQEYSWKLRTINHSEIGVMCANFAILLTGAPHCRHHLYNLQANFPMSGIVPYMCVIYAVNVGKYPIRLGKLQYFTDLNYTHLGIIPLTNQHLW